MVKTNSPNAKGDDSLKVGETNEAFSPGTLGPILQTWSLAHLLMACQLISGNVTNVCVVGIMLLYPF